MRRSKYEFHETREQAAARKRVLRWFKADSGWGRKQPKAAAPVKRHLPGPLDHSEAHAHGCTPSESSKQPRYTEPVVGQWMEPR